MKVMRALSVGVALALCLYAAPASAQDLSDLPPPQGEQSATFAGIGARRPFWESGKSRPFAAAVFDVGVAYFRPTLQFGYGKPHLRWFGTELSSNLTVSTGTSYAGIKGDLSFLHVRLGARYVYPADQVFLEKLTQYQVDDTQIENGSRARYVSAEGEIGATVPAPGGSLFAIGSIHHLAGVPERFNVWEETLHVVVDPPWVWRGRAGYRVTLGRYDTLTLGIAGEMIGNPARDTMVARAGPLLGIALTHHTQAIAAALITFAARDELGLRGADLAQIGLRYRWATGDRWPEFP